MISMLLAAMIAAPNHYAKRPPNNRQVRAKAHQIVQYLKRQDPRVLKSVMYYMNWVPRVEFDRQCKKEQKKGRESFDKWHTDMLLDMLAPPRGR